MSEIINGVPIGDLPGIESVPDDSMLVVEFLGKAYHMPGAVLRQMIQDVLDSMGDSVDDVTEARLTAAIETVLSSGKYNGVSPLVEVLDEEDGTSVLHVVDAFGIKKYPVEVKGARNAVQYVPQTLTDAQKAQVRENIDVSPGTITVKLSGSVTGGFDVVLNGESVTNEPLDRLAEEGYRVVGVAISEVKVLNYKVLAGTLFEYTNVFEFEDNSAVGSQGTRRFVFRVQVDDCNFTLRCTDGVWGGILQPIQATFFLKRNNGVPFIQYNGKTILPEDANWLSVQLILCEVQHRPVFCFQGDMQFFTDNNTAIQPPWGTAFSLRINDDNDYYFATEYDGYELQLLISPDGFVNSARKTSVYKAVESKADDLKAEDGTLFLLSAGEPIGAGVPLPTGSADDSKIFIADLNTSTYEDIKAADDAGKICYALWGGYTACMLTTLSPESAIFTTLLDPHLGLYVKFTKGTVGVSDFGLTESHSVLYEPQSLTDAQKAQARENIGALSADDIDVDSIGSNVYVSGLFSAKYADIKAAYEAGKACFVTYGALLCTMTVFDAEKAEFVGMLTPHIGMKGILYADGTYNFKYVHSNAVQTVDQSLTDDQKAQARTNIGALSTADVDTVLQQAKDSGQFDGKDGYTPVKGKDYFDGYTPVKGKDYFDGANGKTAYAYAQDGGYTGTEAEFAAKLAETGTSDVYVVSLFSAKYAEVKAAYEAGKACFVTYGALLCPLTVLDEEKAEFVGMLTPNMGIKGTVPAEGTIDWTYVRSNAVQTVSQSLSDDQKAQARTNIGAVGYTAPANVAGAEQVTAKLYTSNGGSIAFGKDGPNSGTMIRLDQADGTCRLRFRASDTAGAMVWEQPEQGAQLYVDLGANGSDKHRITFPSSGGTLALTSQIPSLSGYLTTSGTAAKATADANGNNIASTYANTTVANTFNGEQKMINSTHCPTMNDIANGVGCSLKNARACDNQLIVAEIFAPNTTVTDSKINMSAVAGEIGFYHGGSGSGGQFSGKTQLARITSAGIYEGSTLLSNKYLAKSGGTLTGNLTVGPAKIQTNGYVIGTWLQTTAGNASSAAMQKVCVQSPDGWIYTRTLDQLRNDMNAATAPLRVNYDTATQTVDKTLSEIKAAWDAGRSVVLTDGTSVYPLNYVDTSEAVFSSFAINANSKFFFDSVHINSSGKVRYYSYSN